MKQREIRARQDHQNRAGWEKRTRCCFGTLWRFPDAASRAANPRRRKYRTHVQLPLERKLHVSPVFPPPWIGCPGCRIRKSPKSTKTTSRSFFPACTILVVLSCSNLSLLHCQSYASILEVRASL